MKLPTSHLGKMLAVFILISLLTLQTQAWGPLGHKSLCHAAWKASSAELQQKLSQVAERMAYKSFAEACVWADQVRGQMPYDWLAPLHYVNVSRKAQNTSGAHCQYIDFSKSKVDKPDCVLSAIEYFLLRSRDTSLSQRERDEALLLVGHFVGDLHQPLHVAYKDDRGGTKTKVLFNGKAQSLHYLWDNEILYCGYRGSWRNLSKHLLQQMEAFTDDTATVNVKASITQWADESLVLTRSIYANFQKKLPKAYCDQYHSLAIERLALAGKRLQRLLSKDMIKIDSRVTKVEPNSQFLNKLQVLWVAIKNLIF
jgi:hypothetical protein